MSLLLTAILAVVFAPFGRYLGRRLARWWAGR